MKSDNPIKHFILAFLLALIGYAVCYQAIEHRRTRKGPWEVTFTSDETGAPTMLITQPRLALANVQLRFPGETMPSNNPSIHQSANPFPSAFSFSQPRPVPYAVPFGQCVFMDTTFLPGTLTFRIFGHEIELLPRVLILDHQEHSWLSGETISLPRAQSRN